jgi:hypothetical protein
MSAKTISFRADMIDLILAGKKDVTVRPMKPQPATSNSTMDFLPFNFWERLFSESYLGADLDWRIPSRVCPYGGIDDVIAVRERPGIELRITDIIATRLGGISPLLWKRDGIDHTPASRRDVIPYCRHWNSFYGGTDWRWHNELWVWVIEFDLLKEGTRS